MKFSVHMNTKSAFKTLIVMLAVPFRLENLAGQM
jgi:hypothetical protein